MKYHHSFSGKECYNLNSVLPFSFPIHRARIYRHRKARSEGFWGVGLVRLETCVARIDIDTKPPSHPPPKSGTVPIPSSSEELCSYPPSIRPRAPCHLHFHFIAHPRSWSQNPAARDPALVQLLLQLCNLLQTLRVPNQDLDALSLLRGEFDAVSLVRGDGAVEG